MWAVLKTLGQNRKVRKPLGKMKNLEFLVKIKKFLEASDQMTQILVAPDILGRPQMSWSGKPSSLSLLCRHGLSYCGFCR